MRIVDLRREQAEGGARVLATVVWEEADRPPLDLFFQTEPPDDAALRPREAAFLTAAIWPAYNAGERRIAIEGTVCPRLRDGLGTALRLLARWYPPPRPLPSLEPTGGFEPSHPAPERRTAMFLSGGFDSLALLRCNRATYPAGICLPGHGAGSA
ncbi:MAG: hypothetical protein ACT4PV_07910 [Planctomycetaceae bacterium]